VSLYRDNDFKTLLDGEGAADAESVKTYVGVMRAFGFVDSNFDYDASSDTVDDMTLGFYDHTTKELVVRGAKLTPYSRATLAHELTHALDDQWFGLNRPKLYERNDESADAFQMLVEGDAENVRNLYVAAMGPADKAAYDAEENSTSGDSKDDTPLPAAIE